MPETFNVRLQRSAEQFYRQASNDQKGHLATIFAALEMNPFVDNYYKFHYSRLLPVGANVWVDDRFKVVCQTIEYSDPPLGNVVAVIAISPVTDDGLEGLSLTD